MLHNLKNVNEKFDRTPRGEVALPTCSVSIDKYDDNEAAGYQVTMTCNGISTTHEVSAVPNEFEFISMNAYIRNNINAFYKDAPSLDKQALERQIVAWCGYQIGSVVATKLIAGKLKAEHCYIKALYMGKKGRDLQYHGWISVILCKNQEEVKQLNSKQLHQWLTENPETPIYQTSYMLDVEKELTAEGNMNMRERLSINKDMSIMTTAQRFKAKLGVTLKDKMIFSKKGVQSPSKAELSRYA